MKKKMLGILVSFLMLMFAIPVMAAPAVKVAVTATTVGVTGGWTYNQIPQAGILQLRDGVSEGVVTLNIPGQPPLVGDYYSEIIGKVLFTKPPPDPNALGIYRSHQIWTFTGEGTTGTFEGTRHSKITGFPEPYFVSNIGTQVVLHGTNDFAGYTLKLSYDGSLPIAWTGVLITPN